MDDTLIGLAHNLALLLALVFGYGVLRRFGPIPGSPWYLIAYGAVFALGAMLAMLMPIPVANEVIIDNRIAVVALAAPFAGGRVALVAAGVACLMRYGIGGIGTWPGIASLVCAALTGWLFSLRWSLGRANLRWPLLIPLGVACVAVTLPWTCTLPEPADASAIFRRLALPVTLGYPVATLAIGGLLLWADRTAGLDRHLASSELRFRQLVEHAPDAILVADPEQGRILEANRHACALLGRSREELVGLHQSEIHPPDQAEAADAIFRGHVSETSDGSFTAPVRLVFRGKGETTIPVEGIAGLFEFDRRRVIVGFFRDLRERERAASAEALTHHIIDTASALVVGLDGGGRIALCNTFTEELTGWNVGELAAGDWMEALCPRERDAASWQALHDLFQQGGQRTITLFDRAGNEHSISWSVSRIADERSPVTAIGIGIDITEQRRAEHRSRQAEKLQAIGQLAGGVAHDFNNQLQVIGNLAELLIDQQVDERNRQQVAAIRAACRRSADLTGKLLAFSRKGSIRRTPVSVPRLVDETMTIVERSIDKRIAIERRDECGEALLLGDAGSLENALLNLALNARDAMPEGGTITIATTLVDIAAHEVDSLEPGRYVSIAIRDTGTGIAPGIRDHLFEPFTTTKPIGEGTGLGLPAVHGTAREHGGTVTVSSTAGSGACFTLLLPLHEGPCPAADTSGPHLTSAPGTTRLLIVDDEPMIRDMLAEGLTSDGFEVAGFGDGEQAIAWLDTQPGGIDCALVDLNMPGMGGVELIRELHRRQEELPVVVATGFGPGSIDPYIRDHPAISILSKPFSITQLCAHLRERLAPRP